MTDWNLQELFTQEEWERQVAVFRDYNLYQSWAYLQVRAGRKGQTLRRICLRNGEQPCLMAQVRIIRIPLIGLKIGYVQWGPMMRKSERLNPIPTDALERFRSLLIPDVVHVLRIVPNLYTTEAAESWKEDFLRAGWTPAASVRPYHTFLFPLDLSEEDMRKRLHRKWRTTLNKAQQAGLTVSESRDMKYLRILDGFYRASQEKKRFRGLDLEEYIRTQELLPADQKMNAVIISENGEPLSVDVNSYLGDTCLGLFQSTSPRGLEINASYLVWWETFLAAKRAGMKRYDMGGVDPKKNASVYQFKQRIGGEEAFQVGGFEAYANPFAEGIWTILSRVHEWRKASR
jgi:hypothetical protein